MRIPYIWIAPGVKKEVNLYIDDKLYEIVKLSHEREVRSNNDTCIIFSGKVGTGKSNITTLMCAAKSYLSGRVYNVNQVFFDPEEMLKFGTTTADQIIHFDEGVFGLLASDWQNKFSKLLMKFLYVCRKKRHFICIAIPDFFKLKDFVALERSVGLVHTYLRNGVEIGRFVYFREKKKEALYNVWKRSGIKAFNKWYSFRGSFPKSLPYILDEEAYEKKKDIAIAGIMSDDKSSYNKEKIQLDELKMKVAFLPEVMGISQKELAAFLDVAPRTLQIRKLNALKGGFSLEKGVLKKKE